LADALHDWLGSNPAKQLESHLERGHLVLCVELRTPMISRSSAAGSCKLVRIWLSFATSTTSRDAGKIVRNFASRKARAAIALATWSLFVPLGSSWAQPRPADTRRGHELATRLCTNCNAIDRQASSSIRADVPSFSTIANRPGATAEHVAGRIIVPHPADQVSL